MSASTTMELLPKDVELAGLLSHRFPTCAVVGNSGLAHLLDALVHALVHYPVEERGESWKNAQLENTMWGRTAHSVG